MIKDDIIRPLSKKECWEMKEKATNTEVMLQYTISRLTEKEEDF
jgi:hypothetical protein